MTDAGRSGPADEPGPGVLDRSDRAAWVVVELVVASLGAVLVLSRAWLVSPLLGFAALGFGGIVALGWSAVAVLALIRGLRRRPVPEWRHIVAVPAIGLAVIVALWTGVVDTAAWRVSRSSFDEVVAARQPGLASTEQRPLPARRLGAFRVRRAWQQGDAVVFVVENAGWFGEAGFAYLPAGPSPEVRSTMLEPTFEPVGRGWYRWWSHD